jgi:DNA-binding FrmR family transcriptional regulator
MRRPSTLPDEKAAILNRLRSAEGHLRSVIGMFESCESCEQVLHQLDAVEAALAAAGQALRDCEFQRSAEIILHSPDAEARASGMKRLIALYRFPLRNLAVVALTESESDEQTG